MKSFSMLLLKHIEIWKTEQMTDNKYNTDDVIPQAFIYYFVFHFYITLTLANKSQYFSHTCNTNTASGFIHIIPVLNLTYWLI